MVCLANKLHSEVLPLDISLLFFLNRFMPHRRWSCKEEISVRCMNFQMNQNSDGLTHWEWYRMFTTYRRLAPTLFPQVRLTNPFPRFTIPTFRISLSLSPLLIYGMLDLWMQEVWTAISVRRTSGAIQKGLIGRLLSYCSSKNSGPEFLVKWFIKGGNLLYLSLHTKVQVLKRQSLIIRYT